MIEMLVGHQVAYSDLILISIKSIGYRIYFFKVIGHSFLAIF